MEFLEFLQCVVVSCMFLDIFLGMKQLCPVGSFMGVVLFYFIEDYFLNVSLNVPVCSTPLVTLTGAVIAD